MFQVCAFLHLSGCASVLQANLFMIYGICGLLVQTVFLRLLLRWFAESRVLVIGLFAAFTNEVLLALAPNKPFAFGAIALGTVASVSFPAISSIKANNVADSEQVSTPFSEQVSLLCLNHLHAKRTLLLPQTATRLPAYKGQALV